MCSENFTDELKKKMSNYMNNHQSAYVRTMVDGIRGRSKL